MAMEVYFVTGTGTDVGKTYCACRFVETCRDEGKRVGVYKPVASGCIRGEDGDWIAEDAVKLWNAAGRPLTLHAVCPQRFIAPLAPPQAAVVEGLEVDEALLLLGADVWVGPVDILVVEGAGGLFSPISASWLNIDLALQLRELFPQMTVNVIAGNRLGVIHECVATVRAAEAEGLSIDTIVLNEFEASSEKIDPSIATNAMQIERWTGCRVSERMGSTCRRVSEDG